MQNVRYSAKRLAEIVGATAKQVEGALRKKDGFAPEDLPVLREKLRRAPQPFPPRVQLFLNFKGGTGKTSISVAYAYRLAEIGHRVLLIDLDSQGHATQHLGFEGDKCERTLYDSLVNRVPIEDVILKTPLAEFDVIPANLGMTTMDLALMPMAGREYKLTKALDAIAGRYEFVVMDAPPSFGLLNLNAMIASHDLVVPVLPDFLSFHGLRLLFETLGQLEDDLDHSLERVVIVLNQYNPTTRIAREARSALESHYPEFLSKTIIRQCTQFAQASSDGLPINAFAPRCRGAKDIDTLIHEMMSPSRAAKEKSA
jgi:chromosome partitioning protein